MRTRLPACLSAVLALAACATPAQAAFGLRPGAEGFAVAVAGGSTVTPSSPGEMGAGEHPRSLDVNVSLNPLGRFTDGDLRDVRLELPPGFLVNPSALPECSAAQFHAPRSSPYEASDSGESCPDSSQVGTLAVHAGPDGSTVRTFGIFNLVAPHGDVAALGASPFGVPVVLTSHIRESDAGIDLKLERLSQAVNIHALEFKVWGVPWDYGHDTERGNCLNEEEPAAYHGTAPVLGPPVALGTCSVGSPEFFEEEEHAFLTLPTTPCGEELPFALRLVSWQGEKESRAAEATDGEGHPATLAVCRTHLTIPKAQLTNERASSGTGLAFRLHVNDGGGILNPAGIARPAIRNAVIAMPEGLTIDPSLGSGLGICTEAQFARESVDSTPSAGCPNDSKIGDVEVEGMLGLPEPLKGAVFLAEPYTNPSGTLIALYITARNQRRGIFIRSAGKLIPDHTTGKLVTTFSDLPRLLYTDLTLTLREGQRPALASPSACGNYPTDVALASWANPGSYTHDPTSYFPIRRSSSGGACPQGARPFSPNLQAGSLNPSPGAFTPFELFMSRSDPEQEIVSYSATFPRGLTAKLAGIPYCPDAAIEAAKHRSGTDELNSPSCPAASSIGHTLAGYGVGGALAYAPGGLYLAGPFGGAPFSVVAIDSALVGPFDLGVVVVRSAIRIDPLTAQASIDSSSSDPIPHILDGIPLHLRDIRVYVDRPGFTLTPTSCDVLSSQSVLTGSGENLFSAADDSPAFSSDRYQLLGCSSLGFKPRLRLKLLGSRRRGGHPALRAVVVQRPGDANIGTAEVTLPPSEFLAQKHIRKICTRERFDAGRCPVESIYGKARAFSPLLDAPLEGSVYLVSSPNPLPDMVAALRGAGGIAIDVTGRIDSVRGGMRARFEVLPDAPASRFVMTLRGGRKGLLENSEPLCRKAAFARMRFTGQNNAVTASKVRLANQCKKRAKRGNRRHARRTLR